MAQGPSDAILVAIRITLRIRESKVQNPDPPDRRRFVLSECILVNYVLAELPAMSRSCLKYCCFCRSCGQLSTLSSIVLDHNE